MAPGIRSVADVRHPPIPGAGFPLALLAAGFAVAVAAPFAVAVAATLRLHGHSSAPESAPSGKDTATHLRQQS